MRLQFGKRLAFDALGSKKINWKTEKDQLGNKSQGKQGGKKSQGE